MTRKNFPGTTCPPCEGGAVRGTGRDLTIGERVAWYRRRRGLSQEVLAGLVGRTGDWLGKIENGRANLERLSVIKSLADALDVSVGDLLGEPAVMDWPGTVPAHTVGLLRASLMDYPSLVPRLSDAKPLPPADLRSGVEKAWSAYQTSQLGYASTVLPRLITGAQSAISGTESEQERRELHGILASAYHITAATLAKVGEADLAWIASDRGLAAAEASAKPEMVASLLRSVTHSLMANGHFGSAADVASRATDRLAPQLQPEKSPLSCSLLGSLHLVGAMAAARADRPTEARDFMTRAWKCGNLLKRDANYAWTAFGPTNVAVHDVSVALENGDVQVALHLIARVDTSALPVERRVRHALEVARVRHLTNDTENALSEILAAEREAPEQVRYHYIARELVLSWMRRPLPGIRKEIDGLAQRLRLT
jgi:transcriptional regulator with XRE-family HTH domain